MFFPDAAFPLFAMRVLRSRLSLMYESRRVRARARLPLLLLRPLLPLVWLRPARVCPRRPALAAEAWNKESSSSSSQMQTQGYFDPQSP